MSEGQMILMFCVVYSGALSVAIWANIVARQRIQSHIATEIDAFAEPAGQYREGA